MIGPARRIYAIFLRYLYLHKRSLPRSLELIFWPVMELFVWGFLTLYLRSMMTGQNSNIVLFLINAMIFWDILYRSQQSVSISVMEEIWHHNLLNILISPLRLWEWMCAAFLYGLLKSGLITIILSTIALVFYHFDLIDRLGFYLFPLAANLLLFGWVVGIYTSAVLLWWGYAGEALIWGIPFLLQPLSAIFYPLSVLPAPVQAVSRCLPSTYVFEGMRQVLAGQAPGPEMFLIPLALNFALFGLAALFFRWIYGKALVSGRLVRIGME